MSSFSGRLSPKRLCAIIHLHVYCTYVYMYTRIHVYIYTCIHVYIHTYIHIYIYMYIYTYIHAYIYTYIHIYIYTYIHVHIHTNTTVHHASTLQCQTLMMSRTDRSLCSDITASLMQHLLLVMRLQGELGQELQEAKEANTQQDKVHAQALAHLETTNARLQEELNDSNAAVHVQQELAQQLERQVREEQERAQAQLLRADARWATAQDELIQELHCAEVRDATGLLNGRLAPTAVSAFSHCAQPLRCLPVHGERPTKDSR